MIAGGHDEQERLALSMFHFAICPTSMLAVHGDCEWLFARSFESDGDTALPLPTHRVFRGFFATSDLCPLTCLS